MKRTIKILALTAIFAVFATPALAQAKECSDENKAAWYDTFLKNFKGDPPQQKIAYDAAKLYLSSCPEDPADAQAAYMKNKFVIPYEKMTAGADVAKQFEEAVKNVKYADQIRLGKLVLVNDPDNAKVYIILGVAGLNDPSLLSESAQYATKAIEMIGAGKPFAPLFDSSKDKALAQMNYVLAKATVKSDPTAAIRYFLKTAGFDSDRKKDPQLYNELAAAYGEGPVAKLSDDYKKFIGQDETPESKLVLANLNQAIDRQIDAYARAAALSSNPADKKAVMDVLTGLYTDRNKSATGLSELVAGILSKPLPDMPTPLTSLPTTTPTSTPATSGSPGANGGTQTGTNGGAKPAGTTTGTQTGSAKPAATPTPGTKPKPPRSNHRRV